MNKKILIATGIYPPDIGGPASIITPLSNSLRENGFAVKIITYSSIASSTGEENVYRIRKNKIFSPLVYFWKMFWLSLGVDLIYATDTYSVGYFAYLIKEFTGKKYLIRFVGDSAWETAVSNGWTNDYIIDFQQKTYRQEIERLKARRRRILVSADGIIAASNFIAGVAEMIGIKKEKINVIYNSVDFISSDFNNSEVAEIRKKYGQDKKIIVTACRLTNWKGVDGIIKIMPALLKKVGLINFLVLGDGPELDNLKKLAVELGVQDRVQFLGRIRHEEILSYFKAADLFILNTNYEAMSHTLLEAMTAGAPIVATRAGGNPEVIDDGKSGLLVRYNQTEELTNAAIKILTDKSFADELVKNAAEKLKNFNWDNVINKTVKVLREI